MGSKLVRPALWLLHAVMLTACTGTTHEIKVPFGHIAKPDGLSQAISPTNGDAHPSTSPHAAPQEKSAMTTTETNAAAAVNLTLTAEEAGKRFLKLIEGLKSRDDITVERVQEVMRVSLKQGPNGPFYSQPIGDDWFYVISIIPEALGRKKGVMLEFLNRADRHADTPSSCGLNFENYHTALKQMGYEENLQYDEIGRLIHITYSKGDLLVGLTPELRVFPDGKAYPACVRRIGL